MKDVTKHALYNQLTVKQQLFVKHFVETQDMGASIKAAGYDCKNELTADMMARKNLRHPNVKQLVAETLGYQPSGGILTKKELLILASEAARKARNKNVLYRFCSLIAEVEGWVGTNTPGNIALKIREIERLRKRHKE